MSDTAKKGILVVSFGTSHEDTRAVTIDAIEKEIGAAFTDCKIYRAWTSKMILARIEKRDHIHYDNVAEAMERMKKDGITDVIIQPTHVMNGVEKETAVVLMGHGTEHYANAVYAALDYRFEDMGYENVIVGTVEGYPEIDQVLKQLGKCRVKKVVIAPFMIVAGDHAKNDMAGDKEDSWKNIISKAGYEVQTVLKGLGEYESIRKLFVEHARKAV